MSSLFVSEDEEYDDKIATSYLSTSEIQKAEEPGTTDVAETIEQLELPPIEISVERTQQHYDSQNHQNETETSFPVVVSKEPESIAVYKSKEVCCNLPLRFYQEIAETLLSKDCLLILGRGLGCEVVTANVLYALSTPSVSLEHGNLIRRKKSLVILLNARPEEQVKLNDILMELKWMNESCNPDETSEFDDDWTTPLRVVGSSDLANTTKRRAVYEEGGVIFISSRILVVDLLSGIIRPEDITGIFLMHAERVKETSNESLILNLYRDGNNWGFLKAVSDEPESFTGFTPLSTKLKILRLPNVFLWPRFHVEVSLLLLKFSGANQGLVTEISVGLSPKMKKIQSAILSCLQACLSELRRHNPILETDYWDMENVHDKDFVMRVRLSLEPQWHRVSWTSKQLVSDLATLKDLLAELLSADSLTYYQRVQGIIDANIKSSSIGTMATTTTSPWLMMDEATTIIAYSKERALGKSTAEDAASTDLVYNLEEQPKWEQLSLVIDDIMHERSIDPLKTEGPILIMCSNDKIARQLSNVLACTKMRVNPITGRRRYTARSFMIGKLRDYLDWKALTSLTKEVAIKLNAKEEGQEESQEQEEEKLNTSKSFTRGKNAPQSKRRRTRGASAVANVSRFYSGSNFDRTSGAVDLDENIIKSLEGEAGSDSHDEPEVQEIASELNEEDNHGLFIEEENSIQFDLKHTEKFNQVIVETYNDSTNEFLLQELNPSYVIMYEPDLTFIRRVEIYQAMNPASPAKVFFMYYGTSVEEQYHLLKIRMEKQAFTRLIKEKATLGKQFQTEKDNWKFRIQKPHVVNTRIAGGAEFRTEDDEMRIIVDTREFSSSLPNLSYRAGIKVIPCMLTVGDYIISPKICVERKSIPDLIGSFKSGRLFLQCEQMFRHYELPCLLIEFDESKSFSFKPFSDVRPPGQKTSGAQGTMIQNKEIQLKIAELLVSFPKLKVIWSSSPYESAQIFLELKAAQEEPNIEEALSKGVNPSIATEEGPPNFNDDAVDVLQTIPGINNTNYISVIQKVRNMIELVCLLREELIDLLGTENGNKAFNFINHEIR
ncbi:hypothetical protein METBIDRAFT_38064 [Metschnikowia bicuspidata var. bicuspidata NRRL YB-4993]|uniref:ERCC4 domain-containing protein n=1 Tax=Metschnikowia bicuspidata var. bicuspidata NRRL YB-4993 TaxID=869754 RepID=A0A1A0HI59_9ASCO|nr:hypothetical protein METBIDRAFT_38064 [Metschnikowia bicuspidata var. bicuspidata NRRL YB-4993]OBA23690.1 hypothetical protein METBIDRAFT_38064 [Metschnikowia bicuspidata var. bicuspidata NRRL YB-4993]